MLKEIILTYLDKPRDKVKYKRIIWAGITNKPLELNNQIRADSTKTLREEIISAGIYPSLVIYESTTGDKKYAEAN